MKMGSFFSGIGGFELAGEWMGWETIFTCEKEKFNRRILNYYWPKAKHYADIIETNFSIHRGRIDLLTGGFPCQPYSVAGKQEGTEDERHLWPQMLRGIREIQPTWVVGENVRGLVTWNDGLVFEQVQIDLETEGYEVQPVMVPAASVNAPHRRDRIWFIAYSESFGRSKRLREAIDSNKWNTSEYFKKRNKIRDWNQAISRTRFFTKSSKERCNNWGNNREERQICNNQNRNASQNKSKRSGWKCWIGQVRQVRDVTNTECFRREKVHQNLQKRQSNGNCTNSFNEQNDWSEFPTQTPICNGNDGFSSRLDSITFPKWRTKSIEAGGNAIVPQVVYQIFKAIDQYNNQNKVS